VTCSSHYSNVAGKSRKHIMSKAMFKIQSQKLVELWPNIIDDN